ncbi:MAG TPA: FGGY-family carbohydrate kinase [Smithella sp.]|nr:FGGY-family carbohydrate kinase [Smithella sp.]
MEEKNLVLAVDVGTTGTKAVLVSPDGYIDSAQLTCSLLYPERSCVEQSPKELSDAIYRASKNVIAAHPDLIGRLAGIVFTSQMQNTILVGADGRPLMNMLSWMDERAAQFSQDEMFKGFIKVEGYPPLKLIKFLRITGGAPGKTGKDTVCKLAWMKKYKPDLYDAVYKFLDAKDYAVFLATGNYVTSHDMAFVTWLMDTRKKDQEEWTWSEDLHNTFGLDMRKMPEIKSSTAIAGYVTAQFSKNTGIPEGLPVINGAGDLLTSALGSGAIESGHIHVNIGTAGWVATHHPTTAIDMNHYIGTIASGIPGKFLLISKQETLGAALDWIKGMLYPPELTQGMSTDEIYRMINKEISNSPPGANLVILTPWLFGERSPVNNPFLRGQIFNAGVNTTRADLLRAAMEGVAFNIRWGMEFVEKLSLKKVKPVTDEVRLIGGATKSGQWCQIFADVLQKPVVQMINPQMASAQGAAAIAMVSLGIYKSFNEIDRMLKKGNLFLPDTGNKTVYEKLYKQYQALYKNNKSAFKELNH